jgi:hypothetical protein
MARLLALFAAAWLGGCAQRAGAAGAAQPAPPAGLVRAEEDPRLSARVVCSDLAGVQAGSGLVWLGRRLLVAQDSAAAVALVAPETRAVERVVLSGHGGALAKAEKPDFEAAMIGAGGAIYVLGSGSAPARRTIARLEPDGDGVGRVAAADAGAMYDAVAAALGATPNIEGAVAAGDRVRLFHRGAGAEQSARVEVAGVALDGDAPGVAGVTRFDLGRVNGVPLTFTDAIEIGAGRDTMYLAVAEDTPNAIDDGPIVGAAVGRLSGARARYARIVEADGAPSVRKFEGGRARPRRPHRMAGDGS